jgi:glyoxylate reductase
MTLPKVLITNDVPDDVLQPLVGIADMIKGPAGGPLMPRAEVLRLAPELEGIINQTELRVDAELLAAAPKLKIVANVAIGFDNLDVSLMQSHGVWATNVPDAFTDSTADCTLGLLLGVVRRLVLADRYVRSGRWSDDGFQPGTWDGMQLRGKTIGIVGFGQIGQAVARRAEAFEMSILQHDPLYADASNYRELAALLTEADIVSLHVPLLAGTRHLIDASALAQMKPEAILINMSRGPVVDEQALAAAITGRRLAGAGLDVFENEPQVHADLLASDRVVLAPHIGGGTRESRIAARRLCAENVALVLRGERPKTPVNDAGRRDPS